MLKIADQTFELESYNFGPCVCIGQDGWHVSWNLAFYAKSKEVDGDTWQPRITPHLFSTLVSKLEDLNNLKIKLDDPDIQHNEPMFLLYVFEHEEIRNVELTFGKWNHNEIQFTFSGTADVCANENYGINLPISIDMSLKFNGISVDESDESWAVKKFSKFFNLEDFYPPESLGKGKGFIFRPLIKVS